MKTTTIGIRREDKNEWERRVPLTPEDIRDLIRTEGFSFVVQPSPIRVFPDREYEEAGAKVAEDLSGCDVVFAVKEIPESFFRKDAAFVFFTHVIKGQPYNMPRLRALLEAGSHMYDYEKITDDRGQRLVFFGRHAGIAGMTDTLWALGRRLALEGVPNPLERIRPATGYRDLAEIQAAVRELAGVIRTDGLPSPLVPFVCGITGYGNVSKGAQEILDLLPVRTVPASAIPGPGEGSPHEVVKVVFREEDMVEPADPSARFDLQDYYKNPAKYRSRFEAYVPKLLVLVHGAYWDARYPRILTRGFLKRLYSGPQPRLRMIGDISCDVNGSVEANVGCTHPGSPVYVWDVDREQAVEGVEGKGPVVLAVDNLPCEIPRESSRDFSRILKPFVGPLGRADYSKPDPGLPAPLARALIVRAGKFTPAFEYLREHVEKITGPLGAAKAPAGTETGGKKPAGAGKAGGKPPKKGEGKKRGGGRVNGKR
jgi:saccharopine dehydrogenase (NAD+, L-lysine-forming)